MDHQNIRWISTGEIKNKVAEFTTPSLRIVARPSCFSWRFSVNSSRTLPPRLSITLQLSPSESQPLHLVHRLWFKHSNLKDHFLTTIVGEGAREALQALLLEKQLGGVAQAVLSGALGFIAAEAATMWGGAFLWTRTESSDHPSLKWMIKRSTLRG